MGRVKKIGMGLAIGAVILCMVAAVGTIVDIIWFGDA